MTRLLLVRHGKHDPDGRFRQHSCTGLTELGRDQAAAVAKRMAREDVDVVLSSRAARAVQTAEAIAAASGLRVSEQTCDLCEGHPGAAEGLTDDEALARFGSVVYTRIPGAEPWPDWLPLQIVVLHRLMERYVGQTVVAVTHNGVVKASFAAFANMPGTFAGHIAVPNTSITEWVRETGTGSFYDGMWQLVRHGDIGHLAEDEH